MSESMPENEEWVRLAQSDPRANDELITIALTESDEDEAWNAVSTLHRRGSRSVFETAKRLCGSRCPQERKLGADILGQLGVPTRTFPDESVTLLLSCLEQEKDIDVLNSIGVALGHIHDVRAIEPLSRLKNHPAADVRYGVVFGLMGHEEDQAINTLIELASDADTDVRDWATFGIGSQIDKDSTAIRDALHQRLFDAYEETRGEAFVGLAKRGDDRVVDPLIQELSSESVLRLAVEAAELIGDPRLLPALMKLKEWLEEDDDLLERAIHRCKSEKA